MTTTLKIQGMTCNHCVQAVKAALGTVPGVQRVVEVSLERAEAVVEGDAPSAALIEAVQQEGYEARAVA